MPLYEFDCPACGQPFEELVRSSEAVKDVICPSCGSHQVKRKLSLFASKVSGGGSGYASASGPACAPTGT
jgi:putative FmdB family regulatory protein